MSQALRKLAGVMNKSNTLIIFINQLREKIGVLYGNPETTTGGRALKFYSSVRMEVRRGEPIKDGNELIGYRARVKVVKNKVAPPFREAMFDMIYGEGISKDGCILDMAAEADIVLKSGSWYSYGETRLGQGRDKAKQFLAENPAIMDEIHDRVMDHYMVANDATAQKQQETGDQSDDEIEDLLGLDL